MQYVKLWEDWEPEEDWEDASVEDTIASGIPMELMDQVSSRHRLDPEEWGKPSGTPKHFSFWVANTLTGVPNHWENTENEATYELVNTNWSNCSVAVWEDHPTAIDLNLVYSRTGSRRGQVTFDIHWIGKPVTSILDIEEVLSKIKNRFETLAPDDALYSPDGDPEWKINKWG